MSEKTVTIAGTAHEVALERDGARFRAGGQTIELLATRENEAEIRVGGRTHVVPFVVQGTQISFAFDGEIYIADVSEKGSRARAKQRDHSMSAPMPGTVTKILVAAGDVVAKGAPLIILEAMKMEHQITASHDGTVAAIHCKEGEMVQPGTDLIELQ